MTLGWAKQYMSSPSLEHFVQGKQKPMAIYSHPDIRVFDMNGRVKVVEGRDREFTRMKKEQARQALMAVSSGTLGSSLPKSASMRGSVKGRLLAPLSLIWLSSIDHGCPCRMCHT